MNNQITIDGIDIVINDQVVYDAYMMTLPEYVTYYRITNKLPMMSQGGSCGVLLRELYFSLRDQLSVNEIQIDKTLKRSSLRQWLADRNLTIKDMEGGVSESFYKTKKTRDTSPDQVDDYVESGLSSGTKKIIAKDRGYDRSTTPSTPLSIKGVHKGTVAPLTMGKKIKPAQPKMQVDSTQLKGSRLDQVRELIKQGITSPKELADRLGTHVAYIHTLKGKLKNE